MRLGVCTLWAPAAARPNIDTKSAPPGAILAAGGRGRNPVPPPGILPARLSAERAGGGGRERGYLVLGGPRGAGAATPLRRELGARWLRDRRQGPEGAAAPGVSAASGPGVGLRPPAAACGSPGPGATAAPAAAAINLRRRSPDGGRDQRCPPHPAAGKLNSVASEKRQK